MLRVEFRQWGKHLLFINKILRHEIIEVGSRFTTHDLVFT